jgi:NurA-like 5'-3' nuclease
MVRDLQTGITGKLGQSSPKKIIKCNSTVDIRRIRMFLHVTNVSYLAGYKLGIEFDDGVTKEVDLEDELYGEIFEPLKDIDLFKQVEVNRDTNTIEWPNGADFAPEFLHEIGHDLCAAR